MPQTAPIQGQGIASLAFLRWSKLALFSALLFFLYMLRLAVGLLPVRVVTGNKSLIYEFWVDLAARNEIKEDEQSPFFALWIFYFSKTPVNNCAIFPQLLNHHLPSFCHSNSQFIDKFLVKKEDSHSRYKRLIQESVRLNACDVSKHKTSPLMGMFYV
jgi:hypothetical protein